MIAGRGGAGEASESLAEVSDSAPCGSEVRGVLTAVVGTGETGASEAASSSLSSWYLRRPSSGRTPFSMYMRSSTSFWVTAAFREDSSAGLGED